MYQNLDCLFQSIHVLCHSRRFHCNTVCRIQLPICIASLSIPARFELAAVTFLQLMEDLEQLKVLENGYKMKVVVVDHCAHGVDVPADVDHIVKIMKAQGLR